MRRHQSDQTRRERRQRIGQLLIGLFLVAVMLFSILGYGLSNRQEDPFTFNGKRFTQTMDGFTLTASGKKLLLQNLPLEGNAENATYQNLFGAYLQVSGDPAVFPALREATGLTFTFDPNAEQPAIQFLELARFDLAQALGNVYGGVLEESDQYPLLPVVDCAQATTQLPVISFLIDENATGTVRFAAEGDCITVTSDPWGVLAAKDHLLLVLLGVMPDA